VGTAHVRHACKGVWVTASPRLEPSLETELCGGCMDWTSRHCRDLKIQKHVKIGTGLDGDWRLECTESRTVISEEPSGRRLAEQRRYRLYKALQ
jgi:hypothetical protein